MKIADNKTNNLFNFLKGLACIGVVLMHVSFPGITGRIIARLCAFAVPLFVMISGYYSYRCEADKLKKRLRKTTILFLYGLCLFFIIESISQLLIGNFGVWIASIISVKTIIKLIVFCTIDFAIPLWYLIAMIETYLMWYVIVGRRKESLAIKLLPLILALQIVSITICETCGIEWFYKINFVTRAFGWFVLGHLIHKYSNEKGILERCKNMYLIIGVLIGASISVLPLVVKTGIDFSSFGLLIYSFCIFMLGVNNPEKKINNMIGYIGSELSPIVYILHSAVSWFVSVIFCSIIGIQINAWILPIVVVIISLLLAYIINRCEINKKIF